MPEEILGLDITADDAARLMNRFIRKDWIEMEPSLYNGKWFDYRFLNPVQATYAYAREFEKFYRLAYSLNYDSIRAEFISPLPKGDWFSLPVQAQEESDDHYTAKVKRRKKLISGLWRGRMFADAMGMPYAEYLEFAFHWTMRYWKQEYLPRPMQLYTDLVTDRATIAWEERQNAILFFSKLPQYKNTAYEKISAALSNPAFEGKALQSQNGHHEWLFQQLGNRHNDPELFARLIWEHQILPENKVRERVGDDAFELIALHASNYPTHSHYI